ncbi:MAG TPA: L-seryl-tRNA(Sec) selenium transferase [Clostridiales bacterium]|jgi:L-seryl-tRNA(Ser) seleniumtransferase|nr:L-seryl-tRNA(Sec) selenium transferase [Clostridiales bacterium]
MSDLYRNIPKMDKILEKDEVQSRINKYGRDFVLEVIREHLDTIRENITKNIISRIDEEEIINTILYKIDKENKSKFKKVVNGTGVIIHTNLGRSIFSEELSKEISENLCSYTNLEYNLDTGERGHRYDHIVDIIKKITGAEDALVVNNNAAAVLLTLKTLASGKDVIVSRGELVEIGGSFRIPEVIKESGCNLIEVGTTNKTHLKDYRNAVNENTGAIIKIHTSNYKIVGFTQDVDTNELKTISNERNIPLIEDLGSGMIIDLYDYGLNKEPTVRETLDRGVDVVTFSGDKLLGGPQCGVIAGKSKFIKEIKKSQLLRALRVDKFTIMSLELTLKAYQNLDTLPLKIPTIRMITEEEEDVKIRAEKLSNKLKSLNSYKINTELIRTKSMIGGGAYPLDNLDSWGVKLILKEFSEKDLEEKLRSNEIPIIVRIIEGFVVIDCKALLEKDYDIITSALKRIIGESND